MSYHHGPNFQIPDDQRCQALVKGKSYPYEWQRHDHRCPIRANQSRDGKQVCHIHAKVKRVTYV